MANSHVGVYDRSGTTSSSAIWNWLSRVKFLSEVDQKNDFHSERFPYRIMLLSALTAVFCFLYFWLLLPGFLASAKEQKNHQSKIKKAFPQNSLHDVITAGSSALMQCLLWSRDVLRDPGVQ